MSPAARTQQPTQNRNVEIAQRPRGCIQVREYEEPREIRMPAEGASHRLSASRNESPLCQFPNAQPEQEHIPEHLRTYPGQSECPETAVGEVRGHNKQQFQEARHERLDNEHPVVVEES